MVKLADNEILRVNNLKKYYSVRKRFAFGKTDYVYAVDGVSFSVYKGEVFGLVGESGCGKTTTARMIARAIDSTEGEIWFKSRCGTVDMASLNSRQLKEVRRDIQMIFQDPYSSLSPRMSVFDIITEPLVCAGKSRKECRERAEEIIRMVGLNPEYISRYPHAFSGGQRQRIGIARAISLSPSLVLADEPVSALDVSMQAQILNLIMDLKSKLGTTYIFIGHDLGVIRYVCDRVAVMYMGKIVELATSEELFANPLHPYTRTLLEAVPDANPHQAWMKDITVSEVSGSIDRMNGCSFAPRCKYADKYCSEVAPEFITACGGTSEINKHCVACHKVKEQSVMKAGDLYEN